MYSIEVEKTEKGEISDYSTAVSYCSDKGPDWRIPTMIELKAMFDNQDMLQKSGCAEFISGGYWSSSVSNGYPTWYCLPDLTNGNFGNDSINRYHYVRCVRDVNN